MTLDQAVRMTEMLAGFAFCLQSIEHLRASTPEKLVSFFRLLLAALLMLGVFTPYVVVALFAIALAQLYQFQGPYNGGADRMGVLLLVCVGATKLAPDLYWQEIAFGYLALQLTLSYFISGWVKVVNPEWRNGTALGDVFRFSAYPISESYRELHKHPRLLLTMSWAVILFELLFPLAFLNLASLTLFLVIAATFHLANAFLFGLNRFFWIWISAYPAIVWLQQRALA